MRTFRFLDFPVYLAAKVFYQRVVVLTTRMDNFALKDQIQRSSLSVILNIAEGSAKKSDKEFSRFLEIAVGSMNETAACLDIMLSLGNFSASELTSLSLEAESITKQLGGFIKKLKVVSL